MAGLVLIGVLSGCSGDGQYGYSGYNVWESFPQDGDREAYFANDDASLGWTLKVEKFSETEKKGDTEIATFEYTVEDPLAPLYSVKWSSDSIDGVMVHAWIDDANGGGEEFDPPVQIAEHQMVPGESVETKTGDRTWTSTFEGVEACPNHWTQEWDECHKFVVDDGDDDDMAGPPFAGTYWAVPRYGPAIFQTTGYTENWVMLCHHWCDDDEPPTCTPECE